jgi:cytoskeletal protein CcmA (bactofilin family)
MAKNRTEGKLDTVIGPETSVKGDFRVAGGVRLDGQVEGRMDITETLVTGPRSLLKGEVHCRDAVIAGRIEGNVFAAETVELQTGAQVFGNISGKGLVIQRDCMFQGNCSMVQGSQA